MAMHRFGSSVQRFLMFIFIVSFATSCSILESPSNPSLSASDLEKIRANESQYVEAWLSNDADAVMATLTSNPVIIPSRNLPYEGVEAVRNFWFPEDGSIVTITSFTSTIDEVDGSGTTAYVIGRGELSFTYELNGEVSHISSSSVHMSIYEKQRDGSWKIAHRMWHDLPQE